MTVVVGLAYLALTGAYSTRLRQLACPALPDGGLQICHQRGNTLNSHDNLKLPACQWCHIQETARLDSDLDWARESGSAA